MKKVSFGRQSIGRDGVADQTCAAPFRHVIAYEERPFALQSIYLDNHAVNPAKANQLNGPPRQELEGAWDSLMQRTKISSSQKTY